jgi:hypothetical protein
MIIQNGFGFSTRGVAFVSLSGDPNQAAPKEPKETDLLDTDKWARWGQDNLLPKKMVDDIENCSVLMGAIDGKARFGLGKGVKPFRLIETKPSGEEVLEPVNNPEIEEWLEESNIFMQSFGLLKDVIGFANFHCRVKFNNDGTKIGLMIRDDVTEMRYAKKDKAGRITHTYLAADWTKTNKENDNTLLKFTLLPEIGTASYLLNMKPEQRKGKEFSITGRVPGWNRHYYSMPTWYAAKKWVDIAKNVPSMKATMFKNNIRIKYLVTIFDSYWTRVFGDEWSGYDLKTQEEKRAEVYDAIDKYLVGNDNAYKSIFNSGAFDPISKTTVSDLKIETIQDSTVPGELLPDSAAANSEILFALMMNPALMGADTPGGPYSGGAGSGSNIREAALVQVMIQEFERQQLSRILNIVKKVNGWPADIVWRFPGLVLTTLDTGGSTKEVKTGG